MNRALHLFATPFRVAWSWWRGTTADDWKKFAYMCAVAFVLLSVWNLSLQREATKNNRRVLRAIEEQTSPEAQRAQSEKIDTIILDIDCRTQASLQRTIDVLAERGVLDDGDVRAITEACEAQLKASGPP